MYNYFIGVDVGLSGSICVLNQYNDLTEIIEMPTVEVLNSAYKRWYNIEEITKLLKSYSNSFCILEYQRPMTGQGISSTFRLGRGFGLLEGLTNIICRKSIILDPKTWQNYFKKKHFSPKQIQAFKEKKYLDSCIVDSIKNNDLKKRYLKYADSKSSTVSKIKSLFICDIVCYESGKYIDFTNHNLIDAFLIAKFSFYNKI